MGIYFSWFLGDRSSWSVWSGPGEGPLLNCKMADLSVSSRGRDRARELPTLVDSLEDPTGESSQGSSGGFEGNTSLRK